MVAERGLRRMSTTHSPPEIDEKGDGDKPLKTETNNTDSMAIGDHQKKDEVDAEAAEQIRILKQEKILKSCVFTRKKNYLWLELEDMPSRRSVRQLMGAMIEAEEDVVTVTCMIELSHVNQKLEDHEAIETVNKEIKAIHLESQECQKAAKD